MSAPNHKIAYIIIGYNNRDLIDECFESIEAQTFNRHTIIFVDNNSADDSVGHINQRYPGVKILAPGFNSGFAKGNNFGIDEALADPEIDYVALINTDARLDSRWAEKILDFAELKPKGALFQGTTMDYYDHQIIDSTHIFVARNGQGTQGNWRFFYQSEFGPKKVFGVNAAACMVSRKFIESQPFGRQLFDERMFMYLEDVDLAARATVMGWDNYLVPSARAYHMGSASSGKNPGFSLYMTFRNNCGMIYKNFPWRIIWRMTPGLIRGDIDTVKALRRQGKKAAARKVIKGRLVGLCYLPFYIAKRRKMRRAGKIDTEYLWQLMLKGY